MPFTSADLESVNAAISSGELTVSVQGRTVTYRSLDDLIKARAVIEGDIAASSGSTRVRTGYFRFATQRERS